MARRRGIGSSFVRIWLGVVWLGLLGSLVPGRSLADWSVYIAPGLGISYADLDTDGSTNTPPIVSIGGSDGDASPLLEFAVGLEVPMDELVPREWLLDVRLPDWPVRLEFEAAGLRKYEFKTKADPDAFFTELEATTFFTNLWLDIPLTAIYRPIQYTFGLGRQPRIRRWLEPASFYLGAGVGFSAVEIDATSNALSADDDSIGFAWNVGLGLNYAFTERVSLNTGYRFVGLGKQTVDLIAAPIDPADEVDFDPLVHEFRVSIRIRVYDFLSPWR